MKKTAIAELIEEYELILKAMEGRSNSILDFTKCPQYELGKIFLKDLKAALPVEREQMEDMWYNGSRTVAEHNNSAEEYFNHNYTQE